MPWRNDLWGQYDGSIWGMHQGDRLCYPRSLLCGPPPLKQHTPCQSPSPWPPTRCTNAVEFADSQGGNFIDTANGYHNGQSEEWLGEWMALRGNREEMVIATKYTGPYAGANNGKRGMIKSNLGGNGTKSMRQSLEASLKRLQTSYVDVFYVHWWEYTTSIEELMQGLNDLVSVGKVNYLGISDTPAWVVSKANQYARMSGLRQFVVYQGEFFLLFLCLLYKEYLGTDKKKTRSLECGYT